METTEPLESFSPEPGLILNFESQTYLKEAGKWAAFLGIVGFVICGLILLMALSVGTIISMFAKFSPNPTAAMAMAGVGSFITVLYILIDILYFFFSLYLYQFGSRIKKGIIFSDPTHITNALGKLKSFFKLWGILTIVALCFYAIALAAGIIYGSHMSSMMQR